MFIWGRVTYTWSALFGGSSQPDQPALQVFLGLIDWGEKLGDWPVTRDPLEMLARGDCQTHLRGSPIQIDMNLSSQVVIQRP